VVVVFDVVVVVVIVVAAAAAAVCVLRGSCFKSVFVLSAPVLVATKRLNVNTKNYLHNKTSAKSSIRPPSCIPT